MPPFNRTLQDIANEWWGNFRQNIANPPRGPINPPLLESGGGAKSRLGVTTTREPLLGYSNPPVTPGKIDPGKPIEIVPDEMFSPTEPLLPDVGVKRQAVLEKMMKEDPVKYREYLEKFLSAARERMTRGSRGKTK